MVCDIGFFLKEVEDDGIQVDHLETKSGTSFRNQWFRPEIDDVQTVKLVQMLPYVLLKDNGIYPEVDILFIF